MKTFIAALGALSMLTAVAQAEPANSRMPSWNASTASHHYNGSRENQTPNLGAGTSRSSDANQG